jgi:hypothetical protein
MAGKSEGKMGGLYLKRILKKRTEILWTSCGLCEQYTEPSGAVNCGELLE